MQRAETIAAVCAAVLAATHPATLSADAQPWAGEPVVVTAGRSAQDPERVPARVSVITRDDIERIQPPDLLELLRLEAGIDIARAGGPGGQTSVFLRGGNSNHVLVLIDGVRASAAGTGAFTWEILDPALIERIEIVRGPRAARWGSDAIGGVIQIFTRRADGPSARIGYGRFRDRSASASFGDQARLHTYDAAVAWRRVGGFSAQNERGFSFDPDDDGFDSLGASAGGRVDFGAGEFRWRGRVANGSVEFDVGESDFTNWQAALDYVHAGPGPWRWQLSAATLRDRLETETPFGESEAITRRAQAGFQAERPLGGQVVWLIGADAWRESGVSRNQFADDRYNLGAWTGLDGSAGRLDYEASLRVDDDENFGTEVTGNLGGAWRLADSARVFATAGRGFRSPNFSQLFSPGFGGLFAGNPDLDPETSRSLEAGIDWTPGPGHLLTLSAHQTRIDDLIDFAGEDFRAVNIREARITGVEASHQFVGAAWRIETRATWQDPEDRDTGNDLLRRADFNASLLVDRSFAGGHWLGAEIVHAGRRFDVGRIRLPSHTLVNLRGGLELIPGLRLEARLENATDRDYEPLVGFNAQPRSLFVALAWSG